MQQQQKGGFRRFLVTPVGKALLVAATILVVFASFVYIQTIVAIPVFLLFGLALPIWIGIKAPRFLALSGLVVILLVAPVANAVISQEILTPLSPASSGTGLPYSNGSSPVLQNAFVTPYTGGSSTNFTWQVTIYPQYLPYPNSSLEWITLYISSCPGATGNSSPYCSPPYTLWSLNDSSIANATAPTMVTFHYTIGTQGIWDWQMELAFRNGTAGNTSYMLLVGDATYNGLEGPVVGTYSTVYLALLPTLYVDVLLFLGLPFYIVLLIYMVIKSRQRRREDAARRAAGPPPTEESGSGGSAAAPSVGTPGPAPASGVPVPTEGACPNCGAVVYANETTCWKCGASITAPSKGAPLPSGKSP